MSLTLDAVYERLLAIETELDDKGEVLSEAARECSVTDPPLERAYMLGLNSVNHAINLVRRLRVEINPRLLTESDR